jgi:hypothetical protein
MNGKAESLCLTKLTCGGGNEVFLDTLQILGQERPWITNRESRTRLGPPCFLVHLSE